MTLSDRPHGRSRYVAGCRCGTCKLANREYQRTRRARPLAAVTPPPPGVTTPPDTAGPVVAAVRAQLELLDASDDRPALAAIAVALAEVLDNPAAIPQHAAAAHRLVELLGSLSQGSGRRGRLASVRDMTGRGKG